MVEQDSLAFAVLDHAIGCDKATPLYERLNERHIPFLIYSAHALSKDVCKGGINLEKPTMPDALVAAVENLLRAR